MGLFDRGDTRRGIRKALRISWRRRFSHAPPNSTRSRCAAIVVADFFFSPQGKAIIRQTSYLPAEAKGRGPRGRHSADRAGICQTATCTRNQTLSPLHGRKSRAEQGDGFPRKGPWVPFLGGALWAPFSRQGEKGAKKEQTDKPQFEFPTEKTPGFRPTSTTRHPTQPPPLRGVLFGMFCILL